MFPDGISEGWQVKIAVKNVDHNAGLLLFQIIKNDFKGENTSANLTPFGRLEVCLVGVNLLGAIKPLC